MIASVDKDKPEIGTLNQLIEELDPAIDCSISGIRSLAAAKSNSEGSNEDWTVEMVLEEISELLKHDRSTAHRLAAVAAVVLTDHDPSVAAVLVDRLVPMLQETAYERRALETIEHVASVQPTAFDRHLSLIIPFLHSHRDTVSRHAAGTVLAIAQDSPQTVIEELPELLMALADRSNGDANKPTANPRQKSSSRLISTLERRSKLEHAASRLILARALAEVGRTEPHTVAETVVEAEMSDVLVSLFDDDQPRVRSAAAGIAAYSAEIEPEPFEDSISQVTELLEDDNEVVRGGAIWILRALDSPQAIDALQRTVREDPSADLRSIAREAL